MKFVRAGAIYAVANIASAAVPFLLLPLLTRVLGPAEYGSVVRFMMLVTLCQAVAGLSMNAAVGVAWFKRDTAEMPAFVASALVVAIASTSVAAAVVAGALSLWPEFVDGVSPAWGALAALTAGANIVLQCRLVLWQSQQRALTSAALQFSLSAANVTLSLLAVLAFGWGGEGRNGAIVTAYSLAAVVSVILLARGGELGGRPRAVHLRDLLRFALPLVLHAFAGAMLATADRWVVSLRLDAGALGLYGAGAQLGMVLAMLADAFVKAFTPWFFGQLRSTDRQHRLAATGAVYAALPAFLLLALCVGLALHVASGWLLGPRYAAASSILPWFMLGGAFSGVYMCASAVLYFESRTSQLAAMTLVAALVGIAASWWLVGHFGLVGAAAGYTLTQGVLAALTLWMAVRVSDLPWHAAPEALSAWLSVARLRRRVGTPRVSSLENRNTAP